jgi:hypothetical protein
MKAGGEGGNTTGRECVDQYEDNTLATARVSACVAIVAASSELARFGRSPFVPGCGAYFRVRAEFSAKTPITRLEMASFAFHSRVKRGRNGSGTRNGIRHWYTGTKLLAGRILHHPGLRPPPLSRRGD